MSVGSHRYAIAVASRLTGREEMAFAGWDIRCGDRSTTISGVMDQAALHGVLNWVRQLGLELSDVRRNAD